MIAFFQGRGLDEDAQAFLSAIGVTGGAIEVGIDTLVRDLKDAFLWTSILAMYPMVGGTSATKKYNLKDPRDLDAAYRLLFYNAPTIDADGVQFNGTTQYADTHFVLTSIATKYLQFGHYNIVNSPSSGGLNMGAYNTAIVSMSAISLNNTYMRGLIASSLSGTGWSGVATGTSDTRGLAIVCRNNDTNTDILRNGAHMGNFASAKTAGSGTAKIFLGGAGNSGGGVAFPTPTKTGFAFIGSTLSVAQLQTLSTIVNRFMTTMGKNSY